MPCYASTNTKERNTLCMYWVIFLLNFSSRLCRDWMSMEKIILRRLFLRVYAKTTDNARRPRFLGRVQKRQTLRNVTYVTLRLWDRVRKWLEILLAVYSSILMSSHLLVVCAYSFACVASPKIYILFPNLFLPRLLISFHLLPFLQLLLLPFQLFHLIIFLSPSSTSLRRSSHVQYAAVLKV